MAAEGTSIPALDVLFELPGLPAFDLPTELALLYGGSFGFDEPRVVANFVATVDGVVAIPSVPSSNKLIAAGSETDRFVMGLLRASCDAMMVGSGTLAASPRGLWTAEQASPAAAAGFAELRRRLGRPPLPEIAIVSASGLLDSQHPVFANGAIVLTTVEGAHRLTGKLPDESVVALCDEPTIDGPLMLDALRARGHKLILSEGGPHAIGPLLEAGLVDELFLTVSPVLTGRVAGDPRLGLVEGADLLPGGPTRATLLGVRRDADHLFLRYELERP
ncbi:MAG TPA: dihydrofolate reductase family protein [Gaiellaceae bacterium]